jgi:hypothetical protein
MKAEDNVSRKLFLNTVKQQRSTKSFSNILELNRKIYFQLDPSSGNRLVSFSKKITPAIKAEDIETLKTFDINYQLIKFITRSLA